MISQQDRLPLRNRPDFFQQSQQFFTSPLTFFYQQQSGGVAIIIPKKYYRLSTQRHALKRQIAVALQPYLRQLKNTSVAIVATRNLGQTSRHDLAENIKRFLNHIGVV